MMRFFIELDEIADIIIDVEERNHTIIPIMKEYNILELMLQKYGPEQSFIITGMRQGEKLREQLKYDDEKVIEICNFYEVVE